MKTAIANTSSSPTDRLGQSTSGRWYTRLTVVALLLYLFVLGAVGCHSVYREGQKLYPSDPCARLELRIKEAQRAGETAEKAAATLHDRLAKGVAREAVEPDIDRLELATLDFRRRVASAHDAAAACEQSDPFEGELERLEQQVTQMQDTLQTVRRIEAPGTVGAGNPSTD